MMNGALSATLLRALRRLHNWLRINLLYALLPPSERRDLFELVTHHWARTIRPTGEGRVERRPVRDALPAPRPCRVWYFDMCRPRARRCLIIGGNCAD
jgi:hypothetical protein